MEEGQVYGELAALARKLGVSRQRAWQIHRKSLGLCISCGEKRGQKLKVLCPTCQDKRNKRQRGGR